MNIHITLIAYALPISPLVNALDRPGVTWHIYRHSNKSEVIADIDSILDEHEVCYHPHGTNRGLAKSWNDGLIESQQQGADVCVLLNDDIKASEADLSLLCRAAVNNREYGVIEVEGYDTAMKRDQFMNFGFCAINPIAFDRVGYFDQNFFPIYFEDTDYSRRCGLAGVHYLSAGKSGVVHLGSSTIKHDLDLARQNDVTFQKNRDYYCDKWGGEPGSEVWRLPFNSENFGWQIAGSQRHDPYPGYGRRDTEIVRI